MIKNKRIWAVSLACICSIAVLTAFGTAAKKQANSTAAMTKLSAQSIEAPVSTPNGVKAMPMPVSTKAPNAKENPFAGRDAYKNPVGQPLSEVLAHQTAGSLNETVELLPEFANEFREENNPLDVICNIVQGSAAASGFLNASPGFQFSGWINPGPSCAGAPDFPYRIDSVRFQIANAATFGIAGANGAGTAVYRVNIFSTSNCSVDSCGNPGNALCNSQLIAFSTTNTAGGLVNLTVPVNCCVNGPFFVAIEYVSWTGAGDNGGAGGTFRSLWPSLLWSSTARPLCEQWVFNGCTWIDHSSFFTAPANGFYIFTCYGESNVACNPISCVTEAVCDVTCPGGATPEGEPICANEYVDVTNGGCSSVAEEFGSISCGETVCGTSGTFTVAGVNNRDIDYYEFTLTGTNDVTFCATGEFCATVFIAQPGDTGCVDAVFLASDVAPACSTACVTIRLEAGTYYALVLPAVFTGVPCGAQYYASLQCEPVLCQPNFTTSANCNGATPAITGNTTGAGDPCAIGIESHLWQVNITAAGTYNFRGCEGPAAYDQYLYLFDQAGCCVAFSDEDDDLCGTIGGLSFIRCVELTPGTYFLLVTGFGPGDVGQYSIAVSCCQPCPINCVDNEAEVDCGPGFVGTNEGCNAVPPTFETIACGGTKCGTWGYYTRNDTSFRDLDWYKITLTQDSRISATCVGEYDNSLFISSDCPSTIIQVNSAFGCSTNTVTACVPAGDYYIVTAPTFGQAAVPCGSRYTLSVSCEPCLILDDCPGEAVFSQTITGPTENWTFGVSDVQGTLKRFESFTLPQGEIGFDAINFWGIVTQAGNFNLCTEDPMSFSIQVWSDLAGVPNIAAGPVCDVTATLNGGGSGLIYADVYEALTYTYNWPEGTCCNLTSGWISIQGTSVGSPDNCRFLWASSGDSDLGSSLLYNAGVLQPTETFNLAMCLSPCALPCDPIIDLTVYRTPANGGAWLHFTAPQDGLYFIYSTTNPNADADPDGGADPNYTLENPGGTFYTASQAVEWTAPAGFANYKKFVVVAGCE